MTASIPEDRNIEKVTEPSLPNISKNEENKISSIFSSAKNNIIRTQQALVSNPQAKKIDQSSAVKGLSALAVNFTAKKILEPENKGNLASLNKVLQLLSEGESSEPLENNGALFLKSLSQQIQERLKLNVASADKNQLKELLERINSVLQKYSIPENEEISEQPSGSERLAMASEKIREFLETGKKAPLNATRLFDMQGFVLFCSDKELLFRLNKALQKDTGSIGKLYHQGENIDPLWSDIEILQKTTKKRLEELK